MKPFVLVLAPLALMACAPFQARTSPQPGSSAAALWHEAHLALYAGDFERADSVFTRLAADHPNQDAGREAVFYLGSLRIDPRNGSMDVRAAEASFRRYLEQDTIGGVIHRRPEATTMLEITRQLALPAEERAGAFRLTLPSPTATPAIRPARPANVAELQEENERLRRQLQQRDEQIRQQAAELDRIRRALTPRGP